MKFASMRQSSVHRHSIENVHSSDVIPVTLTACSRAGSAIKASSEHLSPAARGTDTALSIDREFPSHGQVVLRSLPEITAGIKMES